MNLWKMINFGKDFRFGKKGRKSLFNSQQLMFNLSFETQFSADSGHPKIRFRVPDPSLIRMFQHWMYSLLPGYLCPNVVKIVQNSPQNIKLCWFSPTLVSATISRKSPHSVWMAIYILATLDFYYLLRQIFTYITAFEAIIFSNLLLKNGLSCSSLGL